MRFDILVTPQGRGRYMARLGERVICVSTRQPLLDAARVLLAEGVAPEARIAMRHEGSPHVALSSTVGKAAKLTVVERDRGNGPVFGQWKPDSRFAEPSPMRKTDEPVPNQGSGENALSDGPAQ
jgi:hypothetical protein